MIDEWILALGTETQRPVAGCPQDRISLRIAAGEQSDFVPLTNKLFGEIANTSTVSRRARARARVEAGNQRPWPADKVERWAIDRLIPYAKNARTHTDAQVAAIAAIAASIK